MLKAPVGLKGVIDVFGDLTQFIQDDGIIDQEEMAQFLQTMTLPFTMIYAYDKNITIKRITCHKLMVEPFTVVFEELLRNNLAKYCKEYGGCYNYRAKRTSPKLSTHSWGIAVDLNPRTNALGTVGNMNQDVVITFKKYGFTWGGDFINTKDPMHFQFCSKY
jgi:hypothetical protein